MSTDIIEKQILLKAPLKRVWKAIADSTEFGNWFGMRFEGPFVAGHKMTGIIVPTTVDSEVAKSQKEYEGKGFEILIEQIEPERVFSFRWHPFAVETGVDYSAEPTTRVMFVLEERPNGVMLTITESGFDQISPARRARAFTADEQGWSMMVKLIEKYLDQKS